MGLSVADTLRQCFKLGLKDQASKIGRDFKVRTVGKDEITRLPLLAKLVVMLLA